MASRPCHGNLEASSSSAEPFLCTGDSKVEKLEKANAPSTCSSFRSFRGTFCASILLLGSIAFLFQPANEILSAHRAASIQHDLFLGDALPTKILFVVTASIDPERIRSDETVRREDSIRTRVEQYKRGISNLHAQVAMSALPLPHEIVVVENNGARRTFLDDVGGISVVYTDNNRMEQEKGLKELDDVLSVIGKLDISDADLIVKMTGRYFFDDREQAPFMSMLQDMDVRRTRAVVKFGSYFRSVDRKVVDCVTGLIAVPAAVVRRIDRIVPIEHAWARGVLSLPENEVHAVQGKMGIQIAPAGKAYYMV
eukprot:CAMPEP_0197715508 /NCGR_PEP_ID=MMETSP1434-20131217/654_1 /TAXON_ID=265543 /ORGANISM="Minutocellus polymorphus, Strain CCMP3303" /LENGTH=310 /DNA_ID=CAMNT_0043299629 /DNA_START=139 /DNA_END=1071 /DNA_ORIENTATION=-